MSCVNTTPHLRSRCDSCAEGLFFCPRCATHQEQSAFYADNKRTTTVSSQCRSCRAVQDAERFVRKMAEDPEQIREQTRARTRKHQFAKMYGITLDDYAAMLKSQAGVCAICKCVEVALGKGGRVKPLAVDHDHDTGKVRGLLCHSCNHGLGVMRDNPALLRAAADYLEANDVAR